MKFNTNSNAYIITYSVVMVVLVAILLAVASLSLKDRQTQNQLNEKKSQIVTALGENPAEVAYSDAIEKALFVDAEGKVVESSESEIFTALNDLKGTMESGKYPVFVAKDGSVVIPLIGNGLWDKIWGYIALEKDMDTVKGIVFDHKGETPGLGAEIATAKHQAKYVGKKIFNGTELTSITLVKGGVKAGSENADHEVDAITGGTKTSNGVTEMLANCLQFVKPFLVESMPKAEVAADESNQLNVENNEQ